MSVNSGAPVWTAACDGRCDVASRRAAEHARDTAALRSQIRQAERSLQQITEAEERLRREISELLHSGVQTRLIVAWHKLGQLDKLIDADAAVAHQQLADIRNLLDQIRDQDVRQATHLLYPASLQIGLVPAVRSLSARFALYLSLKITVSPNIAALDDPNDNRIPEGPRLVAYRVVEEGLNNVARHAQAQNVEISLQTAGIGSLIVQIQDDGCGFDPTRLQAGFGLNSIAARVAQAGGEWSIASQPGRGTTLKATIPFVDPKRLLIEEPSAGRGAPRPIASRLRSQQTAGAAS